MVVNLEWLDNQIAVIKLEDRINKNMFSRELITGITAGFKEIKEKKEAKVVVIHGFDNFFCMGGTKEELFGILNKKVTFTDLDFFRFPLDCELPVISAMQGHAVGGGLVFGLYADIIIMARECIYSANFMKYGFTPGMGATFLLPEKLGSFLANEMLFSAGSFQGGALKERGVPFEVLPKDEVIPTAIQKAKEIAEKPVTSLKLLKKQLASSLKAKLPKIIEQELKMHEISFSLPQVRKNLNEAFGGE